jgi:excisionase family DNA binding protein|tara:strand:+ start:324 stop:509 length:186 start_codon:yes stop_codon:yes gene_type:complete
LQDFFTVAQVASELHLSIGTVRNYINSGKLKASKPGKGFIILKTELIKFMNDTEHKPSADL